MGHREEMEDSKLMDKYNDILREYGHKIWFLHLDLNNIQIVDNMRTLVEIFIFFTFFSQFLNIK